MFEFLRSARVFERLRSACKFLVGRGQATGLEETEAKLTTRLSRALEGELKTGLRVLIFGVGIVGDLGDFDAAFERGCRAGHAGGGIGCEENSASGWWRGGEYSRA